MAIREELDLIRRDFFWEGQSEKKKSHLMREDVIKNMMVGGLGRGILELKLGSSS